MIQKRYTEIPKRQKCINKEEPYIGGAKDIIDDELNKPQSQINQEEIANLAAEVQRAQQAESTLDGKIATEKTRAEGVEGGLNTRLQTVEQLAEISVGGGDIGIGTAADFESDDPEDLAKVPTVGAMLGGANDGVYDISARHSGTKYADLAAALGENGANVPVGVRKGGMSVKYVHTSDNKYVKFFCTTDEFTTDVTKWQGVDDEPTAGSDNLVKSGGIVSWGEDNYGKYVENPEFIDVKLDADDYILWGIKADGTVYFGAGVPPQVVNYINGKIAELSLDEYEDIVTFLGDLIEDDKTLQQLLDEKLDSEGLDANALGTVEAVENPEWLDVKTDSEGKILEGIKTEGTKVIEMPLEIQGVRQETIDNPEFIRVTTDSIGRVLSGRKTDGTKFENCKYEIPNLISNDYLDPKNYGAVYDGVTDCSPAINKCLAKGGVIRIKGSGTALCASPLNLTKSNTHIIVDNTITVKRADNVGYPLIYSIASRYKYNETVPAFAKLKNVSINGGVWDLNGLNQGIDDDPATHEEKVYRGGISIANVEFLEMSDMYIKNERGFCIVLADLNKYHIHDMYFDTIRHSSGSVNTDGIHLFGNCYDGIIEHLKGQTGDDMVACNVSGDWLYSSNICALRLGECKRLTIRDIQSINTVCAVRLLCGDGYEIDEVVIDGVYGHYSGWKGIINISDWGTAANYGRIVIKNVIVDGERESFDPVAGGRIINVGNMNHGCHIDNLSIDNVHIIEAPAGNPYKTHANIIYLENGGSIDNLFIDNTSVDVARDCSDLAFINGATGSSILNIMMSNISVYSSIDEKIGAILKCAFTKAFLTNVQLDASVLIDAQSDCTAFISNCSFTGATEVVDNGYTVNINN